MDEACNRKANKRTNHVCGDDIRSYAKCRKKDRNRYYSKIESYSTCVSGSQCLPYELI